MQNKGIIELQDFMRSAMQIEANISYGNGFSALSHPKIPFDILIYERKNPHDQFHDHKPRVYLSKGQLSHEFPKITARIKALTGHAKTIFARKTVVARLDKQVATEFLKEHHLQVSLPGKYRYGLYYQGELVSVALFSGGRNMPQKGSNYRSFELIRFCHKSDYLVVGGLSKLIKRFTADFSPNDIMTYVDRDWTQESSLQSIGFQVAGEIPGGFIWRKAQQQVLLKNENELRDLENTQAQGYSLDNIGSIKMLKSIG